MVLLEGADTYADAQVQSESEGVASTKIEKQIDAQALNESAQVGHAKAVCLPDGDLDPYADASRNPNFNAGRNVDTDRNADPAGDCRANERSARRCLYSRRVRNTHSGRHRSAGSELG